MSDSVVVFSGGTATNDLVHVFNSLSASVTYVLPISDNGGSTSEIIRVIGGPAIGDIRSRLTRLIPEENEPLKRLLSFRLESDAVQAKAQWNEIVEGTHYLWKDIDSATKEILRAFLIHVHVELLKRSKLTPTSNTNKKFRYELANIGNLFLTGIRLFIGSLDSAIELFKKLTGIDNSIQVMPCISTNFSYHIGALLINGLIITGQSQISHPSPGEVYPPPINRTRPPTPTHESNEFFSHIDTTPDVHETESTLSSDDEELGNIPQYTHPELKKSQLHFQKTESIEPLLSPIERIFYISPHGQEICPIASTRVINSISNAKTLVYSIGSLMTSIVPILVLKGIGKAIAHDFSPGKKRILLLNGCEDRETYGLTAIDYVETIIKSAQYSLEKSHQEYKHLKWCNFVTHLFFMKDPRITVDKESLEKKGIQCLEISRDKEGLDRYDPDHLRETLNAVAAS
ncbi:hypothetical protein ACI3LY_004726 [Candidozyma auris]|uniref:Uncharacterized protein n=2 Tax=Candidozyma auris TaxID=498019 RepID=A0AB36VYT4_CANAR|nr:hypothetical_protein [[Candida] auris]KND96882.2 hypothetical protein QG37_06752 [[Candida] auris]PIS48754.1 hypothetical protein B9J08_005457 [[Candida] auris]PIS49366.1 hypothetical protein CJI97_005540 [[Candida] auris]QEO23858.1 hypothetical_protein [[Candida] auris]QWW24506.1 hypothetical protein CA7LBN_003363 [[Candida] auris]